MIAAGAPITEVQHRLGHANTGITLTVYSHFLRHTDSGAADWLAEVLRASGSAIAWKLSPCAQRKIRAALALDNSFACSA